MEAVADRPTGGPENSIIRLLIAIGVIVAVAVIAFVVYSYERNVHMATQAANVATVFVKSSPKVETNLGHVVEVRKSLESRVAVTPDAPAGWKVDFDVVGQRAKGSVVVIVRNAGGQWNVPAAHLTQPGSKPVDLL